MTKQQYAEFQAAVERNLKGIEFISTGACPGCPECGLENKTCPSCNGDGHQFEHDHNGQPCPVCNGEGQIECSEHDRELAEEASFSWRPCDSCGSSLGGNRYPAHGWMKREGHEDLLLHLNVCTDCLYFLNYGKLDDQSMMEMEQETL